MLCTTTISRSLWPGSVPAGRLVREDPVQNLTFELAFLVLVQVTHAYVPVSPAVHTGPKLRPVRWSSFEHHGQALSDADADRRDAPALAGGLKGPGEGAQDPGAGRAQGVAHRDRAAVPVTMGSMPQALMHPRDCAAKASLCSTAPTWSQPIPAFARALFAASTGGEPEVLRILGVRPAPGHGGQGFQAQQPGGKARSDFAAAHLTEDGLEVIDALVKIADSRGAEPATVALAWLLAMGATAPIASALRPEQLPALMAVRDLTLTAEDVPELERASPAFA
jgi:hypothetical protein